MRIEVTSVVPSVIIVEDAAHHDSTRDMGCPSAAPPPQAPVKVAPQLLATNRVYSFGEVGENRHPTRLGTLRVRNTPKERQECFNVGLN